MPNGKSNNKKICDSRIHVQKLKKNRKIKWKTDFFIDSKLRGVAHYSTSLHSWHRKQTNNRSEKTQSEERRGGKLKRSRSDLIAYFPLFVESYMLKKCRQQCVRFTSNMKPKPKHINYNWELIFEWCHLGRTIPNVALSLRLVTHRANIQLKFYFVNTR